MRALLALLVLGLYLGAGAGAGAVGCQTVEGVPEREDQDAGLDAGPDAADAADGD